MYGFVSLWKLRNKGFKKSKILKYTISMQPVLWWILLHKYRNVWFCGQVYFYNIVPVWYIQVFEEVEKFLFPIFQVMPPRRKNTAMSAAKEGSYSGEQLKLHFSECSDDEQEDTQVSLSRVLQIIIGRIKWWT